jgi:hypothetical protein
MINKILNGGSDNKSLRPDNRFTRFYNFLANMGLVIRDDPPKVIDLTGREWGPEVDGLTLSIRELPREDLRQVTGISVVMKNTTGETKRFGIPSAAFFSRIHGLELTPFGRQFFGSTQKGQNTVMMLGPGEAKETDLPLSTMYNVRALGEYRVYISCALPGDAELRSNEIVVRV